jgi:transcriptional regulator with GAF, ATPase, and Fis domain
MKDSKRNNRIRLLAKNLNRRRKKQAIQIDLLCNDIINAHRDFLDTVRTLTFTSEFYETLIGPLYLDNLFRSCASMIQKYIPDSNIVFFINEQNHFQSYAFDCNVNETDEACRFEQYFTSEVVESIIRANRLGDIDELLQMGLQINPAILKNSSAITVPITANGSITGFILLYKFSSQSFDQRQIRLLCSVRRGLSRAIRACAAADRTASHQN